MVMNPEAQCVALAKFQGWTSLQWDSLDGWIGKPPGFDIFAPIPKYTSCLNAVSEVEKLLSSERPIVISEFDPYTGDQYRVGASDKDVYFMNLRHLTNLYNHIDVFIAATAAQKAEAILRTIGWWKFCAYCGDSFSPL